MASLILGSLIMSYHSNEHDDSPSIRDSPVPSEQDIPFLINYLLRMKRNCIFLELSLHVMIFPTTKNSFIVNSEHLSWSLAERREGGWTLCQQQLRWSRTLNYLWEARDGTFLEQHVRANLSSFTSGQFLSTSRSSFGLDSYLRR